MRLISTSDIPSTTTNGFALLVPPHPPISKVALFRPAIPVNCTADTPGTHHERAEETFGTARLDVCSSIFTADTAPTKLTFFCVPYPTTTTSSRVLASTVNFA